MLGIQREWHKELLESYRAQFPNDKREDWLIIEAIIQMRSPRFHTKYKETWINSLVNMENLDGNAVLARRN
jgi:hypothetical protein